MYLVKDVPAKYLLNRRIANFKLWLDDAGVAPLLASLRSGTITPSRF